MHQKRMLLVVISVIALLLLPPPAFAQDFTLTDVGCSNSPFQAAIQASDRVSVGLPIPIEYTATGVQLKPTGEVCGTCTQKEQYCAQREQYTCNCGTVTRQCNCRTENYDCNCKTQNYDCNCKTSCTRSETYVCGQTPYSCCSSYTYSCCKFSFFGRCIWWGTCSGQSCGTCYSNKYCTRCAQWSTSCQTCQKTVCSTCQKTTCGTCTYRSCDTCERCSQTAWRDITTPCKWTWAWDFTAQLNLSGETSTLADKGGVCLALQSGQCTVRANFSASEEVAFSPGSHDIRLVVTDNLNGVVATAQQVISVVGRVLPSLDEITSPFLNEAGEGENPGVNGVGVAGAVAVVGGVAGAAYVSRKRIGQAVSPYIQSLTASGNFITSVKYYVDEVKVVARNTVNELIGYTPNTSVTERVIAKDNVVKGVKVVKDYPSVATASYAPSITASMFAGAKTEPAKAQPVKQEDFWGGLWNGFTGAVSGLGKAVVLGVKNQIDFAANVGSSLLKGDVKGAMSVVAEKARETTDLLVNTVKDHWKEILIGVVIGAAIVIAAPIVLPALAVAVGVSAATMTTAVAVTGAVAVAGYAAVTYGPALNKVNDSCTWGECMDGGQSIKELQERALTDTLIVGGSMGVGSLAAKPVGAAAARLIPVQGLNDAAAVETYNIATRSLGKEVGYGQFKKIVVVDSDTLITSGETLRGTRAAVLKDVLYVNKDMLAAWRKFPNTAGPHEIGHRVISNKLGKASPETMYRNQMGSEYGGRGIEVAADKNAYMLKGPAYAKEWQEMRAQNIVEPFLQGETQLSTEDIAWLNVVYKNTGNAQMAQKVLSAAKASNPEFSAEIDGFITHYQSIWDTTSVATPSDLVSSIGGLYGQNAAK